VIDPRDDRTLALPLDMTQRARRIAKHRRGYYPDTMSRLARRLVQAAAGDGELEPRARALAIQVIAGPPYPCCPQCEAWEKDRAK
jgi:hypothetical protein